MAKDFVKFMVIVAVLYIGFLTTFTLLARDTFKVSQMSWILIKVFFGSSYLGFDIMRDINPTLGPPLMLIFVCMTNILLITSLISILSDSFSKVIAHSREEYLFVYSVYVLEASTSNRLTHFYPPLNLIPLIFIRPLRLILTADKLRRTRIVVLKATHLPIVGAIWAFEYLHAVSNGGASNFSSIGPGVGRLSIDIPSKKNRPFLSGRANGNTQSGNFTDMASDVISSPDPKRGKGRNENGNAHDAERDARLENEVRELRNQIKDLTTLIMAQQGGSNEE